MKLDDLTLEEMDLVADELDNRQFAIKVNLNENGKDMSESKIRVLKATRYILKKEAFKIREKVINIKNKEKEVSNEN